MDGPAGLRVRIFADGADERDIVRLACHPLVAGFTTNPSLLRAAGVTDMAAFACRVLAAAPGLPFSFEVLADDLDEMERQALTIAGWGGDRVFVKVPVTNSRGESTAPVLRRLAAGGVQLNVTALLTEAQVGAVARLLAGGPPGLVSVFAGRIADTGRDPVPVMSEAVRLADAAGNLGVIWASCREVFNVVQADAVGCHAITLGPPLIAKLPLLGRDLAELSLETVRTFHRDAVAAGLTL